MRITSNWHKPTSIVEGIEPCTIVFFPFFVLPRVGSVLNHYQPDIHEARHLAKDHTTRHPHTERAGILSHGAFSYPFQGPQGRIAALREFHVAGHGAL